MLSGDARASVGDGEQRLVSIRRHANVDRRCLGSILDRVVNDIRDRLAEHQTIGGDRHAVRHVDREPLIPLFRKNPERRHHVAGELPEVDAFAREPDGAGVAMRQAQQCVDEIRQAVDLFEHAADGFFVFRRCTGFAEPDLTNAANHGERRSELV